MNSVQAMNTTNRTLVFGSAGICALAGNSLANKIAQNAKDSLNATPWGNSQKYQQEKKEKYLYKRALCGAVRSSSWISATLLGRYAINGTLPTNNAQTYASLLAFATGGALLESGVTKINIEHIRNKTTMAMILSGGALALVGAYGVFKS